MTDQPYPRAADLVGHPFANAFPMIEGKERIAFRGDIERNSIREQIVLHEGKILDGRNRNREGLALGLIPADADPLQDRHYRLFGSKPTDGDSPRDFVISLNLDGRRHLSESQRALVAAQFETIDHGGNRRGVAPGGSDPATPVQDASLQLDRRGLADRFNVSPRSMASARKVIDHGTDALREKVEQGELAVSVAEKLAALPREQQAKIIAATSPDRLKTAAKQATRELTEKRLADKQRALPSKFYGVILADPAWRWEPYNRETGLDRAADNHYPTQATDDILKLPVGTLAATDCVLFLWATAPMICDALRVMRFWGFEYKSQFIWDKVNAGTGYWNRNRHELLLVGTKGNVPAPAPGTQWDSIITAPAGRHSAKPDASYEMIESYYPNLPRIELNARMARPGWDAWGLEAPEVAGTVMVSGAGESIPTDSPADLRAAYDAALAASTTPKGSYTRSTAESIIRAAYACDPIVPTKDLADAIGHPVGTVLTWAHRLELTKADRRGGPNHIGQAVGVARC